MEKIMSEAKARQPHERAGMDRRDLIHRIDHLTIRRWRTVLSIVVGRPFIRRRPSEKRVFRHHARLRAAKRFGRGDSYAHASELSEAAISRAGKTAALRAGQGGMSDVSPGQRQPLHGHQSPRRVRLRRKVKLLEDMNA